MDKYIAYNAAIGEYEHFETLETAKKWLIGQDFSEGIPSEIECGQCFIAKITHKTKMNVTDKKENYHEHSEKCPKDCDKEEWPYYDGFDYVGDVELIEYAVT